MRSVALVFPAVRVVRLCRVAGPVVCMRGVHLLAHAERGARGVVRMCDVALVRRAVSLVRAVPRAAAVPAMPLRTGLTVGSMLMLNIMIGRLIGVVLMVPHVAMQLHVCRVFSR
jgi:hypothetical protein